MNPQGAGASLPSRATHRSLFAALCGCTARRLPVLLLLLWAAVVGAGEVRRPNFVFILADDLGYMDVGANNPATFYETPNLDRLARQGARFTHAYAASPVCSPTRASILTGRAPARVRITDFIGGRNRAKLLPAEYLDHLPSEEVTFAELLKHAGYATGYFGKWHLGSGTNFSPKTQGFEVNVGGTGAGSPASYFSPYKNPELPDGPAGESLTERLTADTVEFIRANRQRPFLAYLAHYTVHIPLQARKEVIAKYEAKAAALPAGTAPRFLPEGNRQVRQVQDHPVYAAMVQSLDESVGQILQGLEQAGVASNTLVVFFSDNGGLSTAEGTPTSNVPLRAGKGWLYEGGLREPLIVRWPDAIPAGRVISEPVISMDFFPTLLEFAGLPLPKDRRLDGVSLAPLLLGGQPPRSRPLFWHYPHYSNQGGAPACAVRSGDWKLIRSFEGRPDELFNLAEDPSEKSNQGGAMPDRVSELNRLMAGFLDDTGAALPQQNPDYRPGP